MVRQGPFSGERRRPNATLPYPGPLCAILAMLDYRDRFSFNSNSHDLWEVYNSIKKYYPIGIRQGKGVGIYFEYPGLKKLEDIIVENIHNESNFKNRWKNFTKKVGLNLQKEVVDTTFGQAPSFSAHVILDKHKFKNGCNYKQLHFAVSLVGKFFTIYGMDITDIYDKENQFTKTYRTVNILTASPFKEFKDDFEKLENIIRGKFSSYKLIPFAFGQQIIDGLQVRYSDAEVCSVYMALFNDTIQIRNNFRYTHGLSVKHTRGDIYYGFNDWIKNKS